VSVFAQGTVQFNNRISTSTLQTHVYAPLAGNPGLSQIGNGPGGTTGDFPAGTTVWTGYTLIGATATGQYSGSSTLTALLAGPQGTVESSLVPCATPTPIVSFRTGAAAGYTMGGVTATANNVLPDGNATLEMVAWDNSSGQYSTWALAKPAWLAGTIAAGRSGTWNATLGGTATPPFILGVQSFNLYLIPEPSTFVLAGLGAAAVLIFRRRK